MTDRNDEISQQRPQNRVETLLISDNHAKIGVARLFTLVLFSPIIVFIGYTVYGAFAANPAFSGIAAIVIGILFMGVLIAAIIGNSR